MSTRARGRWAFPPGLNSILHLQRMVIGAVVSVLAAVLFVGSASGSEPDSAAVLDQARSLEAEALAEMSSLYAFEEALMTEENDRVIIFFSMPHGARVILNEIVLSINDKPVVSRPLAVSELLVLQGRGAQVLHATRLPIGDYRLRVDVKVMQGRVTPMQTFTFTKNKFSKFIQVMLGGAPARQFEVIEW
jgi:hypothetical protein